MAVFPYGYLLSFYARVGCIAQKFNNELIVH